MKNRRFVWSRTEDSARHIGIALIIASAVATFLEPAVTLRDSGGLALAGTFQLLHGWTEGKQ